MLCRLPALHGEVHFAVLSLGVLQAVRRAVRALRGAVHVGLSLCRVVLCHTS
jgi:hypothetical protein